MTQSVKNRSRYSCMHTRCQFPNLGTGLGIVFAKELSISNGQTVEIDSQNKYTTIKSKCISNCQKK